MNKFNKLVNASIANWDDLKSFGINALTGERCGFGLRLLCDLNQEGLELICKFFAIAEPGFESSWNSQVNGKPVVASIMLPTSILSDLGAFALLQKWGQVWIHSNGYVEVPSEDSIETYRAAWKNVETSEDIKTKVPEYFKGIRWIKGIGETQHGGICTHQMSGR